MRHLPSASSFYSYSVHPKRAHRLQWNTQEFSLKDTNCWNFKLLYHHEVFVKHFQFWRSSGGQDEGSVLVLYHTGLLPACTSVMYSQCMVRERQVTSQFLGNFYFFFCDLSSFCQPWKIQLTSKIRHLEGFVRLVPSLQVGCFDSSALLSPRITAKLAAFSMAASAENPNSSHTGELFTHFPP